MIEYSEIRSIEAVNVSKEKSNEEPLTRNLEKAPISLRFNSMEIDTKDSSEKSKSYRYPRIRPKCRLFQRNKKTQNLKLDKMLKRYVF